MGKQMENMGYNKLIIKSDQEPSIKHLIKAIKRERPESIEEMLPEESEVGEHQSNGMVERAIQTINGRAKAMKIGNPKATSNTFFTLMYCVRKRTMLDAFEIWEKSVRICYS